MRGPWKMNRHLMMIAATLVGLGMSCNLLTQGSLEPEAATPLPATDAAPTEAPAEQEEADPTAAPEHESAAEPSDTVVGTIQATIDEEPHTWYVLRTGQDHLAETTSAWFILQDGTGEPFAGVSGFEHREVPFETFEWNESAGYTGFADYDGAVFGMVFQFDPEQNSVRYDLPYDGEFLEPAISYIPDGTDLSNSGIYLLVDGFLEVEFGARSGQDFGTTYGSFEGSLGRLDQGELLQLTEGRFEVEAVQFEESEGGE